MTENTFIKPKGRVFHMIPWNSDKNIGKSYNESMSIVKSNDWVCFLDGDAVHTSHFFGKRIEEVIYTNPEYSLFTCVTNRVNCQYQIAPGVDIKTNDQEYHRNFGEHIWESVSGISFQYPLYRHRIVRKPNKIRTSCCSSFYLY